MSLAAGDRLGSLQILGPLGAGGMGEVYRAADTRLGREVAIKVLPADLGADPERLARFQREAQLLASLNHPNIGAIHGLEEADGRPFLVLELVGGEDLAERLRRGPLPVDEALAVAKQIAEALEEAHEKGIVHRDLKPANVKLTPEGKVKVLDFGLAKALSTSTDAATAGSADLSQSPTLTPTLTQAGMILGTAAYMSPEQARGRPVDRRADIWAFGVVLFEMLTGRRLFQGDSVSDTLAGILKSDPDWTRLPVETPLEVRRLLRRCLERDPSQRLRDIGDARLEIAEAGTAPLASSAPPRAPAWRRFAPWALLGVALLIAVSALVRGSGPVDGPREVRRFTLSAAPPGLDVLQRRPTTALTLSPDGKRMVVVAGENQSWRLFERSLTAPEARPLDGTEGASDPFFSPDGRWVAFFADDALKRVSVSGGAPETIAEARTPRGGAWAEDGSIVFTPGTDAPLQRVPAAGGAVETISTLDAGARERSHRWPDPLPGGRAVLFNVAYEVGNPLDDADVAVLDLASGTHRILVEGGSFARYAATGHIVYARRGAIVAVPFDLATLEVTGAPVTVEEKVRTSANNGRAAFSFSDTGDLVYIESPPEEATWPVLAVGRDGEEQILVAERRRYSRPRFTADGRTLLVEISEPMSGVWTYDLARGTLSPVTHGGVSYSPVPHPDGARVAYEAVRDGTAGVMMARLDGSGEERLTATKRAHTPTSWTPDGGTLAFTSADSGRLQIELVRIDGDRTPEVFLQGPYDVGAACFSPDGRWVAYVSNESGQGEVYVRPYPGPGERVQISTGGGEEPVWSPDGRSLYFRNRDSLLVAGVTPGSPFAEERPRVLFSRFNLPSASGRFYDLDADYDVFRDGDRFVMPGWSESEGDARVHLVLNWFDELRRMEAEPPAR